ncbi:MAG: DMT family transporter [Desulfosarcinaceae bacterium]|nr:DMT family transporter [Desulfosarcinaceae bacterium]
MNAAPSKQTEAPGIPAGQHPLTAGIYLWLFAVIVMWASNTVVVKIALRDLPPFWAAFLRFGGALPFLAAWIWFKGAGFRLRGRQWIQVFLLALLFVTQIYLFNLGSRYTTGGRVALIIFAYPLIVPLVAPLFLKEEPLSGRVLVGCLVAFSGLVAAFWYALIHQAGSTLKGDLIEMASCLMLSLSIVYNKRLAQQMDKWKVLFWEFHFSVLLFLAGALLFEQFDYRRVGIDAWITVVYQCLAISVICFMSWQYLLARHNAAKLSVFFFAAPLLGMGMGVVLLGEAPEPGLLVGSVLVGAGIVIVNRS